ncbi:Ankyrin-2 [Hyphodiscus hymeniophilus]|uniref:Ankyrin-2 n=1 Tax=Hyphodiscus hymeniophilus TaxID=353542 RepID=A0A9P6VCD6_9HELO|nr:Ankyrin-2 [Hyphodiscus hymeniophilus]
MEQRAEETLERQRSRSSDHNERLEPQLLRAAENDDTELLRKIIDAARVKDQLNENFLRIALMRSSEKGKIGATQYLLSQGAPPDGAVGNRLSPLLRAVQSNNVAIVHLLLAHGANPEAADKKGRRALMTAAWKNHWHILSLLLGKGADVNGKDNRGRNVLHNLAADKQLDWGDEVVQLLLKQDIHIDGEDGQDNLRRSPLHWACATGKLRLGEMLLTRPHGARANVNAIEIRDKTSLHIAAAHDRNDIVEMLLSYGADINARSDGGWTPLHNAAEKGSEKIVRILLESGTEINAKLLNGMTSLHLAAQGGHCDVVKCLLERPELKRAARDSFGVTPFLRAAQHKQKEIVSLLAPFNNIRGLSEDALGACNAMCSSRVLGFNATIVDFGNFHNENRVRRKTLYELLYARDALNPRKSAVTILPDDKATNFRWIHLPANNMAWVEALLTKSFIEEGAGDVEGFKALERSFSHQHRGQQVHSHFMRPLCQSTPRATRIDDSEAEDSQGDPPGPPVIVINGGPDSTKVPSKLSVQALGKDKETGQLKSSQKSVGDKPRGGGQKERGKKAGTKESRPPRGGATTPTRNFQRKSSYPLESRYHQSPGSPGRRDGMSAAKGNIFTFMPYLHFETNKRRQEMHEAIKRAQKVHSPFRPYLTKAATYDEMLIRAHLTTSTVSLHVRRTLDQSFYHNIDTESRDQDQVVYRYQMKEKDEEDHAFDPKVVMVDQLWMWVLGKDLIVTSFPQRWQQPKNDPLNILDNIIEDINSKTRDPVRSVYDLAMIITNRCSGVFARHRMGDEEYQFLDMFESSIGSVTDREAVLFKEFSAASAQASAWLQHHRRPNRFSRILGNTSKEDENEEKTERLKFEDFMRGPLFVDKLLDIGHETDLLAETKDIRDELNMFRKVLEDQRQVLPDLEAAILDIYRDEKKSQWDIKKRAKDQMKAIEMHVKDIDRMDKQAERIYSSITDMLDLKQKHANAFEARFARDQAAGTARQSQTIMVFTIVTIVFLPLSFIAAFFTINIEEFPKIDGSDSLPLKYVSKYMFGIGFAISIPLIIVALLLDDFGGFVREARRRFARRTMKGKEGADVAEFDTGGLAFDALKMEQLLSVARSQRRSGEVERSHLRSADGEWIGRVSREIGREKATGFRMRMSQDVERGL